MDKITLPTAAVEEPGLAEDFTNMAEELCTCDTNKDTCLIHGERPSLPPSPEPSTSWPHGWLFGVDRYRQALLDGGYAAPHIKFEPDFSTGEAKILLQDVGVPGEPAPRQPLQGEDPELLDKIVTAVDELSRKKPRRALVWEPGEELEDLILGGKLKTRAEIRRAISDQVEAALRYHAAVLNNADATLDTFEGEELVVDFQVGGDMRRIDLRRVVEEELTAMTWAHRRAPGELEQVQTLRRLFTDLAFACARAELKP